MEERKFVCKYCSKRYPCGKSLGGHIRTHTIEERNNNVECDNLNFDAVRMKKRDLSCDQAAAGGGGISSIYGLRENPKKTMRFVHNSDATMEQEVKYCKECGKGFPSLKALCGHMACHSEKQKLVIDSQSDTETCPIPKHPRRSKRMRFKTLSINNHPYSSVPLTNGTSSVSEVEQEQEEVARCLMLLSKDSSHKGRFASVTDHSSDNNSVVLETTKSSSVDMRIGINNGKKFFSKGYDLVKKKVLKDIKLKSADNSDSGYFRHGPKTNMLDSDVSNDEFKSEFEDYNVESRKMLNINKDRSKYNVTLSKKSVMEDFGYDRKDGSTRKFDSRKIANYDSFDHSKKTEKGFANDEINETGRKGWKYDESLVYDDSTDESDENSSNSDSFPAPKSHHNSKVFNGKKCGKAKKKLKSKKSMEHECPICYKIFKSGQALGGHKRSHFVGGSEENTVVIKQGAPAAVPCLIDLNLPARVDE